MSSRITSENKENDELQSNYDQPLHSEEPSEITHVNESLLSEFADDEHVLE